jgi:hypothetical protein
VWPTVTSGRLTRVASFIGFTVITSVSDFSTVSYNTDSKYCFLSGEKNLVHKSPQQNVLLCMFWPPPHFATGSAGFLSMPLYRVFLDYDACKEPYVLCVTVDCCFVIMNATFSLLYLY